MLCGPFWSGNSCPLILGHFHKLFQILSSPFLLLSLELLLFRFSSSLTRLWVFFFYPFSPTFLFCFTFEKSSVYVLNSLTHFFLNFCHHVLNLESFQWADLSRSDPASISWWPLFSQLLDYHSGYLKVFFPCVVSLPSLQVGFFWVACFLACFSNGTFPQIPSDSWLSARI